MVCFEFFWSKINPINRKFKMNFQHHLFQETLKIKLISMSKILGKTFLVSELCLLENIIFSKIRCFGHLYTKKNHTRAGTVI
jgi:hypothetical protein